jgi:hypothetical protein
LPVEKAIEMSKHTSGPWKAAKSESGNNLVVDSAGRIIAEMRSRRTRINYREHMGNTDLVAAAPELLEALLLAKDMLTQLGMPLAGNRTHPDDPDIFDCPQWQEHAAEIRAAIRKATGE